MYDYYQAQLNDLRNIVKEYPSGILKKEIAFIEKMLYQLDGGELQWYIKLVIMGIVIKLDNGFETKKDIEEFIEGFYMIDNLLNEGDNTYSLHNVVQINSIKEN